MDDITTRTMLSDVDFILERENEILFVEYKNANVEENEK